MPDTDLLPAGSPALSAAIIALTGVGASQALLVLTLRQFGTARAGTMGSVAPFVGATLTLGLFHDPQFPGLAIAGALMALGVWLHLG